MTVRYSLNAPLTPRLMVLVLAQGYVCASCGEDLDPHSTDKRRRCTLDHVWPRNLKNEYRLVLIRANRRMGRGTKGNSVAVHMACNTRKGNRPPTGCELVWLMAVNARLGHKTVML